MSRLAGWALAHPRRILVLAAVAVVGAGAGLARLELETDGRRLAPEQTPEVRQAREIETRFGLRDPIAVVLETGTPDGVFDPGVLDQVARTTHAVLEIAAVEEAQVVSLETELGPRFRPGTLRKRRLLEPLPRTPEAIAELREHLSRLPIYDGVLVSQDRSAAAVLVGAPAGVDRRGFANELRRRVEAVQPTKAIEGGRPAGSQGRGEEAEVRFAIVGAPVAESLLGEHVLRDLATLVPLSLALMAGIFWIAFRRPLAALLPLFEAGTVLVVVFGTMGWLGVPVELPTAILPVILTAVALADEIHLFRRFREHLSQSELAVPAALRATFDELTTPVLHTSVTTAVGFLAFAASPLPPVRRLGLLAALGVLLAMLFSLTVLPALLVLLPRHAWVGQVREARRVLMPWRELGRWCARHRGAVLAVALLLAGLAIDGARRVEVQDSWLGGFDPKSAFAAETRRFDSGFLGSHVLRVEVGFPAPSLEGEISAEALGDLDLRVPAPSEGTLDEIAAHLAGCRARIFQLAGSGPQQPREWTAWIEQAAVEGSGERANLLVTLALQGGSPRFWIRPQPEERLGYALLCTPLYRPEHLRRLAELESFLGGQPGVGGTLGAARYLETAEFLHTSGRRSELPETPDAARQLWHNYGVLRGEERLRQLVSEGFDRALISVYLETSDYRRTHRLLAALDAWADEHLAPEGATLGLAGDVAVSQALIDGVVTTQVRSLGFSLLGVLLISSLLLGGVRWGLLTVTPPLLAAFLVFAMMGWVGLPLGVATSMFVGVTLGVGIDFAIHLLARWRRARLSGLVSREAVADAVAATGPAIVLDGLAVALGFGVLVFSSVPGNARLGGLLAVAVLGCLAAALVVLPAFLGRVGEK